MKLDKHNFRFQDVSQILYGLTVRYVQKVTVLPAVLPLDQRKKSPHLGLIGRFHSLPHKVKSWLCKGNMPPKAHVLSSTLHPFPGYTHTSFLGLSSWAKTTVSKSTCLAMPSVAKMEVGVSLKVYLRPHCVGHNWVRRKGTGCKPGIGLGSFCSTVF